MIINSRLDNDFYQFTMGQLIHELWPNEQVRYEFRNRTFSVPLAQRISLTQLRAEIEHVRSLKFSASEIAYLRSQGMFSQGYLNWLELSHELPPVEVWMENGHLKMEYEGDWQDGVFWETILLSLVSELYHQKYSVLEAEGLLRLHEKLRYIHQNSYLEFVEFGTRRRWSQEWQERVTSALVNDFGGGQLLGTSNVLLAMTYGLYPIGTMAHQLMMVHAALGVATEQDLVHPQVKVMNAWRAKYAEHPQLMCLLPDTYGTKNLLSTLDAKHLQPWKAVRQDSGDPFEIGEYVLDLWQAAGLPTPPTLIFSDGLDLRKMSLLQERFADRTTVRFGWGTNLTNDLGFESLSLVIKPKSVNGLPCVKLSDNIAKATGDAKTIQLYKEISQYNVDFEETAKY